MTHFYPRPPGGGRLSDYGIILYKEVFLSTPSGWRATLQPQLVAVTPIVFLSTPSGWRATSGVSTGLARAYNNFYPRPPGGGRPRRKNRTWTISYFYPRPPGGGRHRTRSDRTAALHFYPRPPGGGRRCTVTEERNGAFISIHALRVEGDQKGYDVRYRIKISIHALRVEGD